MWYWGRTVRKRKSEQDDHVRHGREHRQSVHVVPSSQRDLPSVGDRTKRSDSCGWKATKRDVVVRCSSFLRRCSRRLQPPETEPCADHRDESNEHRKSNECHDGIEHPFGPQEILRSLSTFEGHDRSTQAHSGLAIRPVTSLVTMLTSARERGIRTCLPRTAQGSPASCCYSSSRETP